MATRSNIHVPHDFHRRPSGTCSQASSLSSCIKSPGAELSPSEQLPHSVKGAPAHLRTVIRKRQNSESAKRSRLRRKEAAVRFYQRFEQQCQRIRELEDRVNKLDAMIMSENDEHDKAPPVYQQMVQRPDQNLQPQPVEEKQRPPAAPAEELRAFQEDLGLLFDSCIRDHICEEDIAYGHPIY